jgi:hypothetical protein
MLRARSCGVDNPRSKQHVNVKQSTQPLFDNVGLCGHVSAAHACLARECSCSCVRSPHAAPGKTERVCRGLEAENEASNVGVAGASKCNCCRTCRRSRSRESQGTRRHRRPSRDRISSWGSRTITDAHRHAPQSDCFCPEQRISGKDRHLASPIPRSWARPRVCSSTTICQQ